MSYTSEMCRGAALPSSLKSVCVTHAGQRCGCLPHEDLGSNGMKANSLWKGAECYIQSRERFSLTGEGGEILEGLICPAVL